MSAQQPSRRFVKAPAKPLIPEGVYKGVITKADQENSLSSKVLIQFEIQQVTPLVTLPMFCRVTLDPGTGDMVEPSKNSKLGKLFDRLFPITPRHEITLDDLLGQICEVQVSTSVLDSKRKPKRLEDQYSVVSEVMGPAQAPGPEEDYPF